jgi:urea-proton symporter
VIILVIIFVFAFSAYATNEVIGSPSKVYDLLVQAAKDHPVEGNAGGSYLTMRSKEGVIFFVINIVGNFGTVFLDNGKVTLGLRVNHLMDNDLQHYDD